MNDLRVLTSIELYLNADFYSKHPYFEVVVNEHQDDFGRSLTNLLPLSVSLECLDSRLSGSELVKKEAIVNCHDKKWSSFLCILGLSSVINRNIVTYYPDCGDRRCKLLFNRQIEPRSPSVAAPAADNLYILFCVDGLIKSGDKFKPNHFVPLIFYSTSQKRKQSQHPISNKVPKKTSFLKNACAGTSKRVEPNISSFFIRDEGKLASNAPLNESCLSMESISNVPNAGESCSSISANSDNLHQTNINPCLLKPDSSNSTSSMHSEISMPHVQVDVPVPIPTNEFDVAFFRKKVIGMNNFQIQNLIRNVFKPDKSYYFPKTNGRSFRYIWLEEFSWLCYSPTEDGAYCLPCVLFGDRFCTKCANIFKLFSKPLNHWNDAIYSFKRHAGVGTGIKTGLHQSTTTLFTSFLASMSGKIQPIDVMVDTNMRNAIAENRKKLIPIIDTIKLCGRLCLPLRGHRDDSKYHPDVGSYSEGGIGNFVELLNFRVRAGDTVLEEHLKNCPKNASYISKNTQNTLIKCCGQVISEKIVHDIKQNKFFSIIADEAADSSNKEQMSLVLRFVDQNMDIREDFIAFLHCKWGLDGAGLATLVLKAINDLTLNVENCRGQGYDGAGAVAGHINGLSAHILRLNKKAIFTHCHSHRLNLTICESCSVPLVRNALTQIKQMSYFFNLSQPRQMLLEKNISIHCADARKKKLADVCRTRWVDRVNGMDTFEELFVPLFFTLTEMSSNLEKQCNPKTSSDASSLLTLISSFKSIAALVISRNVFDITLPVTQLLQAKNIDIMAGIELINSLKNLGMTIRNEIDFYHDNWYHQAISLAGKVGIEEWMPRTANRQTTRDNHPATNESEYYKRSITIPVIDRLNSALQARFDFNSVQVYNGLSIVPTKLISLANKDIDWKGKFKLFTDFYLDDFPNPLALDAELELWAKYWESYQGPRPDSVAATLKAVNFEAFENITVALRILGTLPITSCECERSISALRRLKNYSRSTMVDDRLNGLALMHIHQEIEPEVNSIIDKFSAGNRRMDLI